MQRNAVDYDKVANVSGDFTFCQDVDTPADEVFNLFGTATTAQCAKPGYAFDAVTHESYYLNIGATSRRCTRWVSTRSSAWTPDPKMRCTCGMSLCPRHGQRQGRQGVRHAVHDRHRPR
ncbi:MAG: hypothetical protein ACLTMP_08840 [Eggerthella lenta]